MATLAIDIGNTRVKLAVFSENGEIMYRMHIPTPDLVDQAKLIAKSAKDYGANGIVISSVVPSATDILCSALEKYDPLIVSGSTPCEITVEYDPLESLGADRLASAVGAYHEYGRVLRRTIMVVDAGTSITADLIGSGGSFFGGAIYPGEALMLYSLHEGASLLPKIDFRLSQAVSGSNTAECMLVGVKSSIVGGIEKLYKAYGEIRGENPFMILTGSSASWIAPELVIPHMVDPDIVLIGLKAIWSYNRK